MLIKRLFDIIASALLIVIFIPIFLFAALLVWVALDRPILFLQTRSGLNSVPFVLYKFRSMRIDLDATGEAQDDFHRLTVVGKALRNSSIDELPQLFNVLRGDMSLVGPRPLLIEYLSLYTPDQKRRLETRPGITGWAQIHGRNAVSWEEKFKLDVWYVDNQSFWLDIKILFLTAYAVLTREGISAQGEVTMPKFKGTAEK